MERAKTKDGVFVEKERVKTVAMILANCSDDMMGTMDVKERFMDYAERFIATLTNDELNDFVAHNLVMMIMHMAHV